MRIHLLGALALLLASTGTAVAAPQLQSCGSDAIPLQTTNWTNSVTIPQFDPSLGLLQSVEFELTGGIFGSAAIESLDAAASNVITTYQAAITLTRPDASIIVISVPNQNFSDPLTAFDGTIDFGGTSGITHPNISTTDVQSVNSTDAADLTLFTGPGTIMLPIAAVGASTASGSGNLITQFMTQAEASVKVCYNYELDCNGNGIPDSTDVAGSSNDHDNDGIPDECQPGFRSFCEGDGSTVGGGIDCPCGNNGNPGEGCDNGSGSGGLLTATGVPSVSGDTLMLTASQIPAMTPGMFFGALTANAGGNGTPFDMGLRCLTSPIGLQKLNNGGVMPIPGAPSISNFLGLQAGDTTFFQYIYRNSNGPCIGAGTVNATNGIEVTWGL